MQLLIYSINVRAIHQQNVLTYIVMILVFAKHQFRIVIFVVKLYLWDRGRQTNIWLCVLFNYIMITYYVLQK